MTMTKKFILQFVECVLILASSALSSSCNAQMATIYKQSFNDDTEPNWFMYREPAPNGCTPLDKRKKSSGDGYLVSGAPWWIDPNHAPPGLGYLHLVAIAYHHDWWSDGEISPPHSGRPIDLRNAELTIRWRSPELKLPPEAQLVFWFQTRTSASGEGGQFVNYALTNQPLIPKAGSYRWRNTTLRLRPTDKEFQCLGSNEPRKSTYTCLTNVADALRDWNTDLGLVILMPDSSLSQQISGSVEIDSVTLKVPRSNLNTHENEVVSLNIKNQGCY